MTTARPATNGKLMPAAFIPHGGGPCFFMDWDPADTWLKMADWLRDFGVNLAAHNPRGIVVISAHWEEAQFTVMTNPQPELLFDYSGFPEHTYKLAFPAPGSPELAQEVRDALATAGITSAENAQRGYDHGVFIPLKVALPKADIPIVQLSLKKGLSPEEHLAAGRALAGLREKGVAIIGSGMSYHNLRDFFQGHKVVDLSQAFDEWLTDAVTADDAAARDEALKNWITAPHAKRAHPREEHLLPLMVVAGAAHGQAGKHSFSDTVMGAVVSAYEF